MPDYFNNILDRFDAIVFFDTETSGLDPLENQIIELAAIRNAQFDLLFSRQLLKGHRLNVSLKFLDTLTVYKDRAAYPHKLEAAIRHYKLESKVQNTHRAIDDVCALLEVTKAMDAERADLNTYVNVFGYNPKYGISGEKIAGITYYPQDFIKFKRPERLTLPALAK